MQRLAVLAAVLLLLVQGCSAQLKLESLPTSAPCFTGKSRLFKTNAMPCDMGISWAQLGMSGAVSQLQL